MSANLEKMDLITYFLSELSIEHIDLAKIVLDSYVSRSYRVACVCLRHFLLSVGSFSPDEHFDAFIFRLIVIAIKPEGLNHMCFCICCLSGTLQFLHPFYIKKLIFDI